MRFPFFLLPLAAVALGCSHGPDPNLVACPARKPGAVIIGTGEDGFEPITSEGVPVNHGSQGGSHIWLGVSCKNLGPKVIVHFTITDVATGIVISQPLTEALTLEYDGDGSDLASGVFGYIGDSFGGFSDFRADAGADGGSGGASSGSPLPSDLSGRTIKIEAEVVDDCKKPQIHAEVTTVISSG
jgi:hypothetical protein